MFRCQIWMQETHPTSTCHIYNKRKTNWEIQQTKSVIVRTKYKMQEKGNLQKYQLIIFDGTEKILQASNKNIEEDIISIIYRKDNA